jgi:hypothetical protein
MGLFLPSRGYKAKFLEPLLYSLVVQASSVKPSSDQNHQQIASALLSDFLLRDVFLALYFSHYLLQKSNILGCFDLKKTERTEVIAGSSRLPLQVWRSVFCHC